jgi:transglutaminase-like putative cysteine protease
VALRVRVRGDPSNLQLYWRGQTYDTYTGRGWENGTAKPLVRNLEAGQPWAGELPSTEGRRPIVASIEAEQASRAILYAPGEPIGIDRPYQALLRGPGDLVALTSQAGPGSYAALSHVPEQNTTTLRATGLVYPTDVISRYLQLPANLDPRLVEIANSWTSGSETPYDKAAAIERELRKIPYSLDVPAPPPGRELVSWFLFDLKRGYCDYYASAMVLLARLSDIPARLAIGYGTGNLDSTTGQYVVTEAQAHSWPELYFPGIGWVPFEPTASMPSPERRASAEPALPPPGIARGPEDLATGMAEIQQSAAANTAVERRQAANRGILTAAFTLLLLWSAWLLRASSRPMPAQAGEAVDAFDRFAAWGSRLGEPIDAGDTPREYAVELSQAAAQVAGSARWRKAHAAGAAEIVRGEAMRLTEEVERSLFAPSSESERMAVNRRSRLWAALRELWVAKVVGRGSS